MMGLLMKLAINFSFKAVSNMHALMFPQGIVSIQRSKELSKGKKTRQDVKWTREIKKDLPVG